MLIPSARHTSADIAVWESLAVADLRHFNSDGMRRKIALAEDTIMRFTTDPCYVSISWGKDSTVLAHLMWSIFGASGPPAFWHARPARMPETEMVEQQFLSQFAIPYQRLESDKANASKDYAQMAGTDRHILGVRAEESGVRAISARVHGPISRNSCRPLLWWTHLDIFGYLQGNALPIHPVYGMLGGGRWSRERLRVEVLGGKEAVQFGRAEWEREYYGDIIRRNAACP